MYHAPWLNDDVSVSVATTQPQVTEQDDERSTASSAAIDEQDGLTRAQLDGALRAVLDERLHAVNMPAEWGGQGYAAWSR